MDRNKRDGIIGTVIFHAALLLLILFAAFRTPLPLPEESGMEVNLGYSETGQGEVQEESSQEQQQQVVPKTQDDEEIQSSVEEEAPKIVEKKEKKKPKETEKKPTEKPVEEVKPKVNPNAMYTKNNNKTNSQGISGGAGDQGKPDGTTTASGYDGSGGSGNNPNGNGVGFKLSGRTSKSLPLPKYESNDQGRVVVEVVVDKAGKVIKATAGVRGSTIVEKKLLKQCEEAALRSQFSANENATEQQVGTITYNFIKMN